SPSYAGSRASKTRNAPIAATASTAETMAIFSVPFATLISIPRRRSLHQHDVELLGRVHALALQTYRLARDFLELGDGGRLLVEQPLDDGRTREHEQLVEVELPVLAQDLAEDLVADRLGRLDEPAALAARARLAQQVLEALARPLARHLDEAERRDVHDLRLG